MATPFALSGGLPPENLSWASMKPACAPTLSSCVGSTPRFTPTLRTGESFTAAGSIPSASVPAIFA